MTASQDDRVSRSRYNRERAARAEAEALLEKKSRELFEANRELSENADRLEAAVRERTAELELAVVRAEAASTSRSRFVTTMSHEIRTPLGGLLGMIDLLSIGETDHNKLELLKYAKAAGDGLRSIVNDVLDFSKMEAGVFVFENESVDLRALVESCRFLYSSQGKGIFRSIVTDIHESVPHLFLGDSTRIRQIISNLISNALRYSTDGPIIVRSKAAPHQKGVLLRVEVEDFGIGIPAEQISNLFKDFSQVANPLTAAAQGTGLGLAICKRIADGLRGSIGVETALGVGSTFWFEVPVEVVSMKRADGRNDEAPSFAATSEGLEGKRILIVEDNQINQRMLSTYAARLKLNADIAENGRVALEKFAPGKYDLILMDIAMPEMDGIEATRRIHDKWPEGSVPPVIALTAHLADSIEKEVKLAGFDRILSKPIPFDELKSALVSTLNKPEQERSGIASPKLPADIAPKVPTICELFPADVAETHLEVMTLDELQELTVNFVNDSRARIKMVINAALTGDEIAISQQSHSLKGSCSTLGFAELAELARRIEHRETHLGQETVCDAACRFGRMLDSLSARLTLLNDITARDVPQFVVS